MEAARRVSEGCMCAMGRWTSEVVQNQNASMLMDHCLADFPIRGLGKVVA